MAVTSPPAPIHVSTPANTAGPTLRQEAFYISGLAMRCKEPAIMPTPPEPWDENYSERVRYWRIREQGWHDAARMKA